MGWGIAAVALLVEEDSDRQPRIATDLKSVWNTAQLGHLVRGQLPSIQLKVGFDSRLRNALGNDRRS